MPILLPANPDLPLSQGDVLVSIPTYHTGVDGAPVLNPAPARSEKAQVPSEDSMVMVVSRPCNAVRDETIIVAPIVKKPLQEIKGQSFADVIRVFQGVRDGRTMPDLFYLGEQPAEPNARYFAKFDRLYTITVPKAENERAEFLRAKRRFRLESEFVHDLHVRLFRAFSSLGFDDTQWWTDADLDYVTKVGKAELIKFEAEIARLESEKDAAGISGGSEKQIKQMEKDRADNAEKANELRQRLAPLENEKNRRKGSS